MPKLGDALKKAVQISPDEQEDLSRAKGSSALMNHNRRRIFQYLCNHPCSGPKDMSSSLNLSRSTVKWHIEALVKSEYLDTLQCGKKLIYCPTGFLSRDAMGIFAVLSSPVSRAMYWGIVDQPGIDRTDLSSRVSASPGQVSKLLSSLHFAGLIAPVRDGKHVRYFPTEEYLGLIEQETASQKQFVKRLTMKMKSEHLKPQVSEMKGGSVTIEIMVPGQTAKIIVPTHPFESLFKDS